MDKDTLYLNFGFPEDMCVFVISATYQKLRISVSRSKNKIGKPFYK